jgi:hypothetical protein
MPPENSAPPLTADSTATGESSADRTSGLRFCVVFPGPPGLTGILGQEGIEHLLGDGDDIFVVRNVQGSSGVGRELGALDQDGAVVGEVEGGASALGASR